MTDQPTTETGQRLTRLADDQAEKVLGAEQSEAWVADWWVTHSAILDDIERIEAEAKAQERERLSQHQPTADTNCTCGAHPPFGEDWFAHIDPEADR